MNMIAEPKLNTNSNSVAVNTNKQTMSNQLPTSSSEESADIFNVWDKGTKDFNKNDDIQVMAYEKELPELIDELNAHYNPLNLSISFAYNEDLRSLYVQVRRIDTDEVIRQIPSEEIIKLMKSMREMQGAIFDTQV